jgi:energy-coupling factor transport system ATP-binding protein
MIEFRDVTFVHQGGVKALDGVSLRIGNGETVAIVGENGAGKTTLVKHATGLLKPTAGSVLVDGEDAKSKTTAELSRKTGVAFQNPDHQLFSESVEEEVAFGLRNFGFAPDEVSRRTAASLERFGLTEYAKSSPLTLSGGEKKRLTIACILAWDPDTVILDEPTVGQDAIQKRKLTDVARLLREQGKTLVIVSHDIEFLWPMQPRTVVMARGRVIADGPASEVMLDGPRLSEARVSQPQLVRLFQKLERRPAVPFADETQALKWAEGK